MAREKLPSDIEGAEQTGFLHGSRQLIKEFRAKMYTYQDKAGKRVVNRETGKPIPPVPGIVCVFQNPQTKAVTSPQFYSNGNAADRVAAADGSGFELAEGSGAKHGLVKGGGAHRLLSSIAPLWPEGKRPAALADYRKFEGALVELVAQPIGKVSTLAGAADPKTIPVVGAVVRFPWGPNPEYGAGVEEEAEEAAAVEEPVEEPVEEEPKPKRTTKGNGPDAPEYREAQEAVQAVLALKRYRRGIALDDLAHEVGEAVDGTKLAPKVLKLVQDTEFLQAGPWEFDAEEQTVRAS